MILNDFIIFVYHFFQTQIEMIVVLVVFWKRYRKTKSQMVEYPFADFKLNQCECPATTPDNITYIGKFLDDEANITYKYGSAESYSINKTIVEEAPTFVLAEDSHPNIQPLHDILEEDQSFLQPGGRSQIGDSNSRRLAKLDLDAIGKYSDMAPSSLATDFEK